MMVMDLVTDAANGSVEEWEGDVGKSWRMQKAWESWSIFCNCSQESVWSIQEVGLVPSGEMGGGRWSQRGRLHVPTSCYICPWELQR